MTIRLYLVDCLTEPDAPDLFRRTNAEPALPAACQELRILEARRDMTIEPVDQLTDSQIADLTALYQHEWWSAGRSPNDVRRMLAHTDLIYGFIDRPSDRLVAFCRVLTDFTYRATVYDVIVSAEYRDTGLGRRLVETVLRDARLQQVAAISLHCKEELRPFYLKCGFEMSNPLQIFMQFVRTFQRVQRTE